MTAGAPSARLRPAFRDCEVSGARGRWRCWRHGRAPPTSAVRCESARSGRDDRELGHHARRVSPRNQSGEEARGPDRSRRASSFSVARLDRERYSTSSDSRARCTRAQPAHDPDSDPDVRRMCLRKAASRRTPPSPQSEQVGSDPDVGTGAFVFAEEGFDVAYTTTDARPANAGPPTRTLSRGSERHQGRDQGRNGTDTGTRPS